MRGGFNISAATTTANKNAVKILGYWDIFKNYYANKQERIAYFIGSYDPIEAEINTIRVINPNNINQSVGTVKVGGTIKITDPNKIYTKNNVTLWITQTVGHSPEQMTAGEAGSTNWQGGIFTITLNDIPTGKTWWIRSIQSIAQQSLETFSLDERDNIS